MARNCWSCSTGCFIYNFVIQVISEKPLCSKDLLAIWEIFLHKNNPNYNSYIFSYKFAFVLFLSFLLNQKHEFGFQQVCGLVARNISVFFLFITSRALLQSHAKFNGLLERNFLNCYSCSYYNSMLTRKQYLTRRVLSVYTLILKLLVILIVHRSCETKTEFLVIALVGWPFKAESLGDRNICFGFRLDSHVKLFHYSFIIL